MAEDAVARELLSAKFPANREKYREYRGLIGNVQAISFDWRVLWPGKWRSLGESEQGSIRERTGNGDSLLPGFADADTGLPGDHRLMRD
jgi:hypothetical protein